MRKGFVALVVSASLLCLAGCFEAHYVSGAPDGTIMVSTGGRLFRVKGDMSEAVLIAEGVARAEFSPDGERLLVVFEREDENGRYAEVALCDADAKIETILARLHAPEGANTYETFGAGMAAFLLRPRWSPDGAFVSWCWGGAAGGDVTNLHIREVEGSGQLQVPNVSYGYAWSPDSSSVAVAVSSGNPDGLGALGTVQIIDVRTGRVRHELAGVLFEPQLCLGWDREGAAVLFSARAFEMPLDKDTLERSHLGIFMVDLESGSVQMVTPPEVQSREWGAFAVSPDGAALVCTVGRSAGSELRTELHTDVYTMALDGTEIERIHAAPGILTPPRWLPGGGIVFGEEDSIHIISPQGYRTDLMELISATVDRLDGRSPPPAAP